ncbi:MAG: hypothetical protein KBT03_06075 [Bacteroidales bacterium]|nr:hypothetical protein [Candidatus Scybalousia scybalohippi]
MTLLEKCKKALRIRHSQLDEMILEDIDTARLEMRRAGVVSEVANSDNKLVEMAICAYVQMKEGNDEKKELYEEAWKLQLDDIRKSGQLPEEE